MRKPISKSVPRLDIARDHEIRHVGFAMPHEFDLVDRRSRSLHDDGAHFLVVPISRDRRNGGMRRHDPLHLESRGVFVATANAVPPAVDEPDIAVRIICPS